MKLFKTKTMKKTTILSVAVLAAISLASFSLTAQKLVSTKTHFKFFSSTPAEDIEANNYKAVGTIETSTGDIVFSVPSGNFGNVCAGMIAQKLGLPIKHFIASKIIYMLAYNVCSLPFNSHA